MAIYNNPNDISGLLGNQPTSLTTQAQREAAKGRDQQQLKETAEETFEEFLESEYDEDAPIERVKDYIKQAYEDARCSRMSACIDEKIIQGRRLMKGEYTAQERAMMPEIDVWFNLVAPISNIALAFLRSILQGDEDNPLWELRHSPIPDLPDFIVDRATEFASLRIQQESLTPDETGQIVPITEERAIEIVEELRDELFDSLERQAEIHTRNLQREISSVYSIANFYQVLDEFLQCLVIDPVACIKGPIVSAKKIPEWKDGNKIYPVRKYQHYETVDAEDFYPSPDSVNPQDGAYVIHMKRMTRRELQDAMKLKGFIAENIDIILCEYEHRSRDWLNQSSTESETAHLENKAGNWRDYEGVEVIEYHGKIPGHVLHNSDIRKLGNKKVDPKETYEMEIWMTCDHIIRIVECCNPSGRPFFCASLYPCKGSIWGESIPHRAMDEQRSANAALRAAIRDMGYTSGPMVQVDVSFLDKHQKVPNRFAAGKVTHVNSRMRGAQGKAITFEQLQTQAPVFLNLVNTFFQNAELNTGFNRQMLGQAQPGISTLGEANILQGNAVTGLRSMLVPIDRVIEDITEMTACQIMRTTDDPALKADARVVAKGSSHLLDRQLNRQNILQFFNTVFPISQQAPGLFEPFAMGCLIRELATTYGFDPDKFIPDPSSVQFRNEELLLRQQQLGLPQAQGGGIAGGVSQPPQQQALGAGVRSDIPNVQFETSYKYCKYQSYLIQSLS